MWKMVGMVFVIYVKKIQIDISLYVHRISLEKCKDLIIGVYLKKTENS